MELTTARLHIRPFEERDRDAFLAYFNDPEIWRLMGYRADYGERDLRGDFAWRLENPERVLALALREDDRVVGHIVIGELDPPVLAHPVWGRKKGKSFSFALHREFRRQGLMKEALGAVIDRLFAEDAALDFINGGWFSDNTASAALHRSLGFHPDFVHKEERSGRRVETIEGFLCREARQTGTTAPGFRSMRRFRQQLGERECLALLEEQPRGVLAVLGDEGYPYAVPLDFLYRDGKLYFHGAREGHRLDAVRRHDKVSFCVMDEGFRREGDWALNIRSVIVFGRIRPMAHDEVGVEELLCALGKRYNPDPDDVERELQKGLGIVQLLELTIEHMSGKLVREA